MLRRPFHMLTLELANCMYPFGTLIQQNVTQNFNMLRHMSIPLRWAWVFGPELLLTQEDIAEGDVFNVTWTGSSIISRGCPTVSLQSLKRDVPYRCKAFRWVTTEIYRFQITPNLSPIWILATYDVVGHLRCRRS